MLVPNPRVVNLEIRTGAATNPYRKTAGHKCGARLFAGQNTELNHQRRLFGTSILSSGKISILSSGCFLAAALQSTLVFRPSRVSITPDLLAYSLKSPAA